MTALSDLARPIHAGLTDQGESVELVYEPNVPVEAGALADGMEMELVIEPVRKDEQGRPVLTYKYRPAASNGTGA